MQDLWGGVLKLKLKVTASVDDQIRRYLLFFFSGSKCSMSVAIYTFFWLCAHT